MKKSLLFLIVTLFGAQISYAESFPLNDWMNTFNANGLFTYGKDKPHYNVYRAEWIIEPTSDFDDEMIGGLGIPLGLSKVYSRPGTETFSLFGGKPLPFNIFDFGLGFWFTGSSGRFQPYGGMAGHIGIGVDQDVSTQTYINDNNEKQSPILGYFDAYIGAKFYLSDHLSFNSRIGWGRMNLVCKDSGDYYANLIELTVGMTFDIF